MTNPHAIQAALHRAADRVAADAGTPDMDALATAVALFLEAATFNDEDGTWLDLDSVSVGYGAMLGWLAARNG